jgi:drug/metabolite transporter (DMT)-like permease
VQPFAFLQLVFASIVGIVVFSETLRSNVAVGALMITGAGVFALLRERQKTTAS